jgi:hypothetical protein
MIYLMFANPLAVMFAVIVLSFDPGDQVMEFSLYREVSAAELEALTVSGVESGV